MKKINFVLVMLFVFIFSASADEWLNFNDRGESAPIYDVSNSTSSLVEFELEIPGMKSIDVDIYNRVYIPEHAKMDSIGFPEVPVVTYLIAIPECDNVNLNVTLLDSVVIDNITIYPAPEWVEVNNGDYTYLEEQFTINSSFYNSDEYFPGYTGELVEKGAVRTQHCIRVKVYPVQFNPVQQQVIAYSRVNIEMTFDNAVGSVNEDVGIFNEVCGNAMINYNSNGLNASVSCGAGYRDPGSVTWLTYLDSLFMGYGGTHCDYLIITHEEFWYNDNLQALADKRDEYNGFDVVIVKTEDFLTPAGYHDVELKNLIKNTYDNGYADNTFDNKLGYVNLFSDVELETGAQYPVPTHDEGYDVYFSQLTEICGMVDVYPDILLGRCPVDSTDQVANICQKIIDYEPIDIGAPGYDGWKDRMTFLAGDVVPWDHINQGLNMIAPFVETYDTTVLIDEAHLNSFPNFDDTRFYDEDNLLEQYAEGNLVVTYMGHGGTLGWVWPSGGGLYGFNYNHIIDSLYYNKLPFIFSMACVTGAFQSVDDCMAENFLIADSIRGSIGFIGASIGSNAGAFSDFVPHSFEAFSKDLATCGEMLLLAKLKTSCDLYRNHYNLFGDPALNILLDSLNIGECDLVCSPLEIDPESIDNQTLIITAGVKNLSNIDVENVDVKCILNESYEQTITIDLIEGMHTGSAVFNYDISSTFPTTFTVEIIADPDSLIAERNENNNEAETEYDYYCFQNGFPAVVNKSVNTACVPSYNDNYIILDGMKISTSGEIIWYWEIDLPQFSHAIPIYDGDSYDYIASTTQYHLYRIEGDNGDEVNTYVVNGGDEVFCYFCLGDLNNDGEYELVAAYKDNLQTFYFTDVVIFDLDGILLTPGPIPINYIKDIAIGDGNNDGKNEIYILRCADEYGVAKVEKYDYDDGVLTLIDEVNLYPNVLKDFALDDFNDDGELDCVIFSENNVTILNCSDLNSHPLAEISLTPGTYDNFALGDIDNDGVTEIVVTQDAISSTTWIYKIDILDSGYELLFSENNIINNNSRFSLYDLNSDHQLDIILSNHESINGHLSNGDLIFAFPSNLPKTHNTIVDVDSDGDIEIIFGVEATEFSTTHYTKISASDIDIAVSNSGNIYPRMNELRNNLYSQPVYGTLRENTDYYWYGSITLHDEVILPETSTITIHPGTIIKAKENSKLTVYGDLIVNGTENEPVTFEPIIQGVSQDYWQGLEFPEGNGDIVLNHVEINNANLNSEREITINGGSFINTPLLQDRQNLSLSDVDFNNSPITAELYGISELETISIYNCYIHNSSTNAGIEITGYPNIDISYNVIENCNSGIKIWESGSGIINSILNNIIRNNTQNFGIFIYHSYIDITDHNRIENNRVGLFISRESNFNLIGSETYPLQIIRDNNEHEVRFTYDSRPSQFYHNKIYDENHEYSYVKCEQVPPIHEPIDVSYNNWGSTFNPETDLSPTELFIYLPIWDPGPPEDPIYGPEGEMYLLAKQQEEAEDYFEAEQTYKQLISIYPVSEYAKIAAKELLALKVKYDQDFAGLKLYYETEPNMQYDEEMINLSAFLINCCNIKLEEFQPAITWFEEIIQNPPSTVDSVFAVIDAGYTYLMMENGGRAQYVGKIMELKPESRKQYEEKRDNLMNMLFGDSEPDNEIPSIIKLALFPNYPNPFNPSTAITFSIPKESKVELTVYNIKGQKVKTIAKDDFEKGFHKLIWNGKDSSGKEVGSGVYFYKLKVNGKDKSVRKCLLLK